MYRLCYIENNVMYFSDNFPSCRADDWDDAPYEHNAGTPYEYREDLSVKENRENGYSRLRYVGYVPDWEIKTPAERFGYNTPFSVDDINNGAVPWLYHEKYGGLMAGTTINKAIKWLRKAGIKCAELK